MTLAQTQRQEQTQWQKLDQLCELRHEERMLSLRLQRVSRPLCEALKENRAEQRRLRHSMGCYACDRRGKVPRIVFASIITLVVLLVGCKSAPKTTPEIIGIPAKLHVQMATKDAMTRTRVTSPTQMAVIAPTPAKTNFVTLEISAQGGANTLKIIQARHPLSATWTNVVLSSSNLSLTLPAHGQMFFRGATQRTNAVIIGWFGGETNATYHIAAGRVSGIYTNHTYVTGSLRGAVRNLSPGTNYVVVSTITPGVNVESGFSAEFKIVVDATNSPPPRPLLTIK